MHSKTTNIILFLNEHAKFCRTSILLIRRTYFHVRNKRLVFRFDHPIIHKPDFIPNKLILQCFRVCDGYTFYYVDDGSGV